LLQESLERRFSEENISEHRSAYIKRAKRRAYAGVLDVSFSSDSSDFYYDTAKSQKRRQTSQGRNSRPLRYRKSASKKSVGRKSYDDVLQLLHKSAQGSRRSLNKTQSRSALKSRNPVGDNQLLFNRYLQKKEEVMKERAKRLVELNNVNISKKIRKQTRKSSR